jgi:hypothetical protein
VPSKKIDGFEIIVHYRDEHPWPHAHVERAEDEVVINLGDKTTLPSVNTSIPSGMSSSNIRKALDHVTDLQKWCLSKWRVPKRPKNVSDENKRKRKKGKRRRV